MYSKVNLADNLYNEKDIISILISQGLPMDKAKTLTEKLYLRFDNLFNISNAPEEELMRVKGISSNKAKLLRSIPYLIDYYLSSSIGNSFSGFNRKDLINYLILKFSKLKFEAFALVCLDINKKIISIEQIFRGTIDSATIYPRDLVEKSLSLGSRYVIISHNHPSGILKPSKEDISVTELLHKTFFSVHIKLLDHIIIANNSFYSFRDNGILDKFKK